MTAPTTVARPAITSARRSSVRARRRGEGRPRTAGARTTGTPAGGLSDEQSVVLWQTCAYAGTVVDAARAGERSEAARRDLIHFLRCGPLTEYAGIRGGIEAIEASRGPRRTRLAVEAVVADLERRIRREPAGAVDVAERWALPLLLRDDIELASLPSAGCAGETWSGCTPVTICTRCGARCAPGREAITAGCMSRRARSPGPLASLDEDVGDRP
jgi:hypothetical protein